MAGQPQIAGILTFDVTDLQVNEPGLAPTNVIQAGVNYELSATFDGDGVLFPGFEAAATAWNLNYYAEGIGAAAPEVDLGTVAGNLSAAGGPYTAPATTLIIPAGTLAPGLYKLACMVTFPAFPLMAGFQEGPVIQVL